MEVTPRERELKEQLDHALEQLDRTLDQLDHALDEVEKFKSKVERLEAAVAKKADAKGSKKPKLGEKYSIADYERKTTPKRKPKPSTGRRPKSEKFELVDRQVDVYPQNADPKECSFHATQFVWRLLDGKAVYIQYNLYTSASDPTPILPLGVRSRKSEFGTEIALNLAYLHYWHGNSIDAALDILSFYTGLKLSKSQSDSLLRQLADDWSDQYETIADLIAMRLIVYIDETGWKIRGKLCYTWVFSAGLDVLFRCGVGRDKGQAQAVLGERFAGIGVTDDYAAYANMFSEHQLCWAHFLRKAIRLSLQNAEDAEYREFLESLFEIYREAVRYRKDGRLSVGRAKKVSKLKQKIRRLCQCDYAMVESDMPESVATWIRLQRELSDNVEKLFVFVQHPEVEPTNNRSERNVRREAIVRKAGRTSKSESGARRRSVLMTVLASLRNRLEQFTLYTVLSEITRWWETGQTIFEAELARLTPNLTPD